MTKKYVYSSLAVTCCLFGILISCKAQKPVNLKNMPTICILGGTPSTKEIAKYVPDSLKERFNIISFDRPGFGENEGHGLNTEILSQLAGNAGLRKGGFGVIGISGGGPMALYLASEYNLEHCGIINGMVSKEAYFKYSDSAVTKDLMMGALESYGSFEDAALKFPNIDRIVKVSGADSKEQAIKACYNEFRFMFSEALHRSIDRSLDVDWWHGEDDSNVPLESVKFFLEDYQNARLTIIPNASHDVDLKKYIAEIIGRWE